MHKYVIMGVQGSGKGTQAAMLAADFDLEHINVGDILRWNIQHHTKIGAQVKRVVAAGQLASDELVEALVRTRIDEHDWNYGFVIDGFQRNAEQAVFFLERYDIDGVIHIDVPDEEVEARIVGRRLCSGCRLDYNLIYHRPVVEDTCDVCGGQLIQRVDDSPQAVRARLRDYHEKTAPVLDLFRRKEVIVSVSGTEPPAVVQREIRRALNLRLPVERRTGAGDAGATG